MPRAGCQLHLSRLIEHLNNDEFEHYLVLTKNGGELLPKVRSAGCTVFELRFEQKYSKYDPRAYLDAVAAVFRFVSFLKRTRPSILHGHLFWSNIIGVVAGRLAGVPYVITSRRQLGIFKQSRKLHRIIENFSNRFVDRILVNSDAVRRDVIENERNVEGKTFRIYNGVVMDPVSDKQVLDARRELNISRDSLVLLAVGNLRKCKGHDDLIEAFSLLAPAHKEVILLIAGDDRGMLPELKRMIAGLELEGCVRLLGGRRDIPVLLSMCDIFIHPSLEEGFSNAVLEAMTCGKPIVATNVGGTPEALVDEVSGLLVPPGEPRQLANAIEKVIQDVPLRAALGTEAGRQAQEKYTFTGVAQRYREFYESFFTDIEKGCGAR